MERRSGKIIVGKAGGTAAKGAETYKISIPTAWVKQMDIGESREIELAFDGKTITIQKRLTPEAFVQEKKAEGHTLKKIAFYDGNVLCSNIYADFTDKTLQVENFSNDAVKLPFGNMPSPTWKDFESFLAERCVPSARSGLREYLEAIGVEEYNPVEIIQKTDGRMAEDNQWIKMEDIK